MTAPISKCTRAFSETEIDGEIVVMDLARGDFFSLTGPAAAIWRRIDGSRSRDALVAELAAEYAVDPGAMAADVDAFLAQLTSAGLIESL